VDVAAAEFVLLAVKLDVVGCALPSTSTISVPGKRGQRRSNTSNNSAVPPSNRLATCHSPRRAYNSANIGASAFCRAWNPHSFASCRTVMTIASPSVKPRTTGRAMNCAMRPRRNTLLSRKNNPASSTSAAAKAVACAAPMPGIECSAEASTAADDDVAVTIA